MPKKPTLDPIVEEVRNARAAYARRFGFDLDAIARDLMRKQKKNAKRLRTLESGTSARAVRR